MVDETNRGMQQANLDLLVRNGGFNFTDTFFPYTSGEIGPFFINGEVALRGKDYAIAVDSLVKCVLGLPQRPEFISCGESRDWCFGPSVFYALTKQHGLDIPCVMIYKDKTMIPFGGRDLKGKQGLHLADLNNEGSSPRDKWVPAVRDVGGEITDILFYVDRQERGVGVMQELGLRSHAVVPLDQGAWEYLAQNHSDRVTPAILAQLRARTEMGQDAWALQMLKSDAGRRKWAELYHKDDKNKAKVDKVAATYILKFPDVFSTQYFDDLRRVA